MIRRIRDRGTFSALAEAPNLRAGPVRVRYVPGPELRVAFSVPKRAGHAVARNRVRRRLRAAVGQACLPPGAYLVGGDAEVLSVDFDVLRAALDEVGRRVTR